MQLRLLKRIPVLGPILITNVTFEDNPTLSDDVVKEDVTPPTVGKTKPTYPEVPSLEGETTPLLYRRCCLPRLHLKYPSLERTPLPTYRRCV